LFRLLLSCQNIFSGEAAPLVRFSGEKLEFLRDIRAGKFEFEYLMEEADKLEREISKAKDLCDLPEDCDMNKVNDLYRQIVKLEGVE